MMTENFMKEKHVIVVSHIFRRFSQSWQRGHFLPRQEARKEKAAIVFLLTLVYPVPSPQDGAAHIQGRLVLSGKSFTRHPDR